MKKLITIFMAAMMLAFTLASCKATESKTNDSKGALEDTGSKADDTSQEEPVELSFCAPDNTFGLSTDPEMQEAVIEMLEKKTNTKIDAIIPPISSYNDKVETMMSGGEVPDVFQVSQAMTRLPNYVAREQVMKLDDLIEKSELLKIVDSSYLNTLAIDGHIYNIPYYYPRVKCIFVREDIMEKYDIQLSETPTTEEFLVEMSKLKDSDIVPFSFPKWIDNFQFFLNSFDAVAGIYKNEDGKYVDGMQEEQMKDALEYLRELYTSGVIDQEFITTENNTMREAVYSGKAASDIDYVANYTNYILQSEAADNYSDVQPIYMLKGPEGKGGGLNESIQTAWCISSDCKNPEAAMRLIEALTADPETHAAFFNTGIEGIHYTIEDGVAVATEKASNTGYSIKYNYLTDAFIKDFSSLKFQPDDQIKSALETQANYIEKAMELRGDKQMIPSGKSMIYDESSASITNTWKEIISQIVLGSVSVDEGINNYINFWDSVEGDTMLKELNG